MSGTVDSVLFIDMASFRHHQQRLNVCFELGRHLFGIFQKLIGELFGFICDLVNGSKKGDGLIDLARLPFETNHEPRVTFKNRFHSENSTTDSLFLINFGGK